MRIAALSMLNWLCYRGEHRLDLQAKAYAVVARREEDPERSNFCGKSSLPEAVYFVLSGRHRHRTEDEFITRGEKVCEVSIVADDGTRIIRRREKGKRTTLHFYSPEVSKGAMQDEAQALVDRAIGLSPDDFLHTCYFQQRQMARLVLADPGSRQEMVSGWLRLAPLERCEDRAEREASVLADQVRQMEAQLASLDDLEKHALDGMPREKLEEIVTGHVEVLERRRAQVAEVRGQIQANARLISARGKVEDFERLIAEGKKLRAELEAADVDAARARHDQARESEIEASKRARIARSQLDERRVLYEGKFDGKCPVAGIECPAREQINADRQRSLGLYQEASERVREATGAEDRARREEATARAVLGEHERREARLQTMREQVARLEDDYELARQEAVPADPQVLRLRFEDASRRLDEAMTAEKTARARIEQLDQIARRRETIQKGLAELRARLATYREAATIFGKQGAQRRLAEGSLAEIEEGANEMLSAAAIGLSVSVRWSREGQGLARTCDACGAPFPTSVRVKVCSRCQAARGPNLINRLDLELSDRSGAAEDLAGAALQLSASAWLRRGRGSAWSTAMLDEPFGQLDVAHRRAFGAHLAQMLRSGCGYEQALVVAHSPDVLHALPGRIEVVGGANGSTVRVVA